MIENVKNKNYFVSFSLHIEICIGLYAFKQDRKKKKKKKENRARKIKTYTHIQNCSERRIETLIIVTFQALFPFYMIKRTKKKKKKKKNLHRSQLYQQQNERKMEND